MKTNNIGWCHITRNPIVGCSMKCTFENQNGGNGGCYARQQAKRKKHVCQDCYEFTPHLHLERLKLVTPRQKPKRIFVGSMADIADFVDMDVTKANIPTELPDHLYWLALEYGRPLTVLEVLRMWMGGCSQHTFLLLTKRPTTLKGITFARNVWIGVTVTRHEEQKRFHNLVQTGCSPAGNYFVSFEPLLESISWQLVHRPKWAIIGGLSHLGKAPTPPQRDWVVRLMSSFEAKNIPIYTKENMGYDTLKHHDFPPGFPVYEGEVR